MLSANKKALSINAKLIVSLFAAIKQTFERLRPQSFEIYLVVSEPNLCQLIKDGKSNQQFFGDHQDQKLQSRIIELLLEKFVKLYAFDSGVKDLREIINRAKVPGTIPFVDEVHNFNKSQQDTLLTLKKVI